MKAKYFPSLDGIRTLAILLVMLLHSFPGFSGGGVGVDMFFVLSGWLITGVLLGRQPLTLAAIKRFYLNRMVRLYPALLTVALGVLVLDVIDGVASVGRVWESVAAIFYLYPVYQAFEPQYVLQHTWTLALEWYFYLVFPLLLLWLGRARLFSAGLMAFWLGCSAYVAWQCYLVPGPEHGQFLGLLRVSAIALGCWLRLNPTARFATVFSSPRFGQGASALLLVALLATTVLASKYKEGMGLAFPLAAVAAMALVQTFTTTDGVGDEAGAATSRRKPWLRRLFELKPVVWLGSISYEIYLWHFPLVILLAERFGLSHAKRGLVAYPIAIVAAWLTHKAWQGIQSRLRKKISVG